MAQGYPVGPHSLARAKTALWRDQRFRLGRAQPVERRAVLAPHVKQVSEALGRDQRGAGAALLEKGVGAHRHAVSEGLDAPGFGPGPREHLLDGSQDALRLVIRGGGRLGGVQRASVEDDRIGERPADVDAKQHARNLFPTHMRTGPDPSPRGTRARSTHRLEL